MTSAEGENDWIFDYVYQNVFSSPSWEVPIMVCISRIIFKFLSVNVFFDRSTEFRRRKLLLL